MPHDKSGKLLAVGDRVLIPATVTHVQTGDDYCNCTVKTDEVMPPYKEGTSITLNTKQVEKLEEN